MKMECLGCHNNDFSKFAPTKKGFICLMCFEKSIHRTGENQAEIALIEVEAYLSRKTGGNNRKFTSAYKGMINKLSFLESLPEKSEAQTHFVAGFREALKTFEAEAK